VPRKFKIYIHTVASATVPVELSDEDIERIASDLEVDVSELTLDDLTDVLAERAFDNVPTVGVCCSGWNEWEASLELGDEWELSDDDGKRPHDAFSEVTNE